MAMWLVSLGDALRWGWSALMCPFRCPWPGMALVAGRPVFLVICMPMAKKGYAFILAKSPSCSVGRKVLAKAPSFPCPAPHRINNIFLACTHNHRYRVVMGFLYLVWWTG